VRKKIVEVEDHLTFSIHQANRMWYNWHIYSLFQFTATPYFVSRIESLVTKNRACVRSFVHESAVQIVRATTFPTSVMDEPCLPFSSVLGNCRRSRLSIPSSARLRVFAVTRRRMSTAKSTAIVSPCRCQR